MILSKIKTNQIINNESSKNHNASFSNLFDNVKHENNEGKIDIWKV